MFIYVDGKADNSMGIRGDLNDLHSIAEQRLKELFKKNPRAEITTKIMMYI